MLNSKFALLIIIFNFSAAASFAQSSPNNYDDEFATYEAEFSKNTQTEIYDPLEKINRKIFSFNNMVDIYLAEPVARAYRNYTPRVLRNSLHNFVTNLTLPFSALNSFAQGKVENGLATSSNFLINTTIGIGGLFDIAGDKKIKYRDEDFGQTLGYYGIKNGPYLILPLLGPSTGRDFAGSLVDRSVDPTGFNLIKIGGSSNSIKAEYRTAGAALATLDLRERLIDPIADARKDSFDLYATFRSVYVQQRDLKIKQ